MDANGSNLRPTECKPRTITPNESFIKEYLNRVVSANALNIKDDPNTPNYVTPSNWALLYARPGT